MEAAFGCNYVSTKSESVYVEVTRNMLLLLVKKCKSEPQNYLPKRLCRCQQKSPDASTNFLKVAQKSSFGTLGVA